MDLAGIDVREKIDLLQLPLEAKPPAPAALRSVDRAGDALRLRRQDEFASRPRESGRRRAAASLRRFADDRLKPDLESVDGSAAVKVSGGYEDEIQIFVDQQKLAQLGLSIDTVARRLRAENVNLSGGRLEQGTQRFLVRTLNEFPSVQQMADAIIATVDGRPVYLRDVATRHAAATRTARRSRASTAASRVELAVYKEGDANTVQLAERHPHASSRSSTRRFPAQAEIVTVYDQSQFIAAAIGEVQVRRAARRPARDPRAVPVPARRARDVHHRPRDPGVGHRHLHADVHVRPVAQHHVARRHRARGRHAGRQRGRRARSIVRKREDGHSRVEAAQLGTREVSHCDHRRDADFGRGVLPDGVHHRHRRPAVPGPGADGDASRCCSRWSSR